VWREEERRSLYSLTPKTGRSKAHDASICPRYLEIIVRTILATAPIIDASILRVYEQMINPHILTADPADDTIFLIPDL
jgi:hypothetical protein